MRTKLDRPQGIIFDVDDTLVDVTNSYRRATMATGTSFGVDISFEDIAKAKAAGDANNDWVLTRTLLARRGVEATLEEVTRRFEEFYQGAYETRGFCEDEPLLMNRTRLVELSEEFKLGIVTGRPRQDAERFLDQHDLRGLFQVVVTMDDAPLKPDPAPVKMALEAMGIQTAWMFGDTPDDIRAAIGAGVIAFGVIAPADDPNAARQAMLDCGATEVFASVSSIDELLAAI